ncbi:14671_t:CDS:2 [Gigaspora margarita]|uniref:14671_t:CDS:1 n=1 Tax=Gigaspora margarita TaxID=4874 RepID=A0ABN7VY39_GIGMA|nr:14671_t:CDS:2 [Gigaspora margarita]
MTDQVVNCEVSTSYAVNAETSASHANNAEADTLCDNDDVDSFLKAYSQYNGFVIIKKRAEQHDDGTIKHRSFGYEFGKKYIPKKALILMFTIIDVQSKDVMAY